MPIRIKKPPFKHHDKVYRIWSVVTMGMAVLLTAALTFFVREVIRTDDPSAVIVMLTAAAYLVFFAGTVGTFGAGIKAYVKEDNAADLMQSLLYILAAIFCLLNLRFMLVVVLNALNNSEAADKLIGTETYEKFIAGSYPYWVCMGIGLMCTFVIGLLAVIKLVKNRKS